MLTYDNKNFQGENLGTTTLELVETQDGIRIKRSLDFIGFKDDFKNFILFIRVYLVLNKFAKNLFFTRWKN